MVTKIKNKKFLLYTSIGIFILVLVVLIPLGFATGYSSEKVFIDNSNSSANGKFLKDAIDDLNYYARINTPKDYTCKSNTPKCRRATTLHTETCNQTSGNCISAGYANGDTITYGNTTTYDGILTTGDAFDCDVNGDGTYDAATERFYYVSEYYDTETRNFNDKVAVLIYYSNVRGGVANTEGSAYDCVSNSTNGPVLVREQLPTTSQWSNIRLYKETRQLLSLPHEDEGGTLSTVSWYGPLPLFVYGGNAARLITFQEVYNGCNSYDVLPNEDRGLYKRCQFLMEGTKFSNPSLPTYGIWQETVSYWSGIYKIAGGNLEETSKETEKADLGARPVIEVLKSDISY